MEESGELEMRDVDTRMEGYLNDSTDFNAEQPEGKIDLKKFSTNLFFGRFLKQRMDKQHKKTNKIVTSHYTNANWFPKSALKQFKKPVNNYFLLITVLHFLPFSPKKPAT